MIPHNKQQQHFHHPSPSRKESLLKELWQTLTRKNPAKQEPAATNLFNKRNGHHQLPENIYEKKGTRIGEHVKRFHNFHYRLKYKLAIPLLLLLEKQLSKDIKREVPKEIYNRDLQAFNDAWERAVQNWAAFYMAPQDKEFSKEPTKTMLRYREESTDLFSCRQLRTIKALQMNLALNDTAYREFYSMFAHELYTTMHELHQGKEAIVHPLFMGNNISHPAYFAIWQRIKDGELEVKLEHLQGVERENKTVKETEES